MAIFGAGAPKWPSNRAPARQYRQEPEGRPGPPTWPPDLAGPLAAGEAVHAGRHLGGGDVSVDLGRRQTPMT